MFRFLYPEWLYALGIIPVLIGVFLFSRFNHKRALEKLGDPAMIGKITVGYSSSRLTIRFLLVLLTISFLILSLARPQYGTRLTEVKRRGVEIMIALDVSNSMLATDIQPNRLERAKQAISALLDQMKNDRIGLIVFAGTSYIQVPITTDYVSVRMFLDAIRPDMIPSQGTAIGAAIRQAVSSFPPNSELERAIIIISDGENHEDDAVDAAKDANKNGITVHTIGLGNPNGSPIPLPGGGENNFLKDQDGQVVISRLNEELLNQVAVAGEGTYIRASNTRLGLNELFNQISGMEKKMYESKVYTDYDEKFMIPAMLALICLLLDMMMMDRTNKWLARWNLFKLKV
jgi:Ca-activated chloride channel family protein